MEIKELEINETINFTDEGIEFTLTRSDVDGMTSIWNLKKMSNLRQPIV